jgi:hypothetical protein
MHAIFSAWNTRSMRYTAFVCIGFLVIVLGGYLYVLRFMDGYAAYSVVAKQHRDAAFFVANEQNPVREELNRLLTDVLEETIPDNERLTKAQRGLELLGISERSIDAIGEIALVNDQALLLLEGRSHLWVLWWWHIPMRDVVTLAQSQAAIIADIRGLSYRANFHTAQIFRRIVDDEGRLTDAHIGELNNLIPKVEDQFDQRSNLYNELERVGDQISMALEKLPARR